tara:strand:- start:16125 stop:17114 length:990 start_codon:yes stop_codon:yes gene_type:complete
MSEEKSSLVEEVKETTSTEATTNEAKEFNPLAFTEEETPGTTINEKEESITSDDEGEPVTEEDGWTWDKKEEATEEKEPEEEYEWEVSTESKEEDIDWKQVSKQLGLEGASKNEIKAALDAMNSKDKGETNNEPTSPQIETLENYLSFSNKELVIEELKAEGLDEAEIDDTIDKMQRNGMIALKGKEIKRTIKKAIQQQKEYLVENQRKTYEEQNAKISEARQGLQSHLKEMDRFMGGKVTKKQKEEVYRFATKDMAKELWASHANVADVAMFLLYKDQIKDILRSQGRNEGSKSLMDKIQSPSLGSGKNRNPYQPKNSGFDPKAFMRE